MPSLNRRQALASLLGLASAAVVDPEQLLWTPGRKLISIPKQRHLRHIQVTFRVAPMGNWFKRQRSCIAPAAEVLRKRIREISRETGYPPEFLPLPAYFEPPNPLLHATGEQFGFKEARCTVGYAAMSDLYIGTVDCLVKI